MPNGSLLKQKRPNGVMNVVNSRLFLANGIYQNPLLASSLLITVTPVSCANISSTPGNGCVSLIIRTLSLRGFKLTQLEHHQISWEPPPSQHTIGLVYPLCISLQASPGILTPV